ncbi:MAG: adenylate/guanylate cyclase domain-containing protein, partial [Candidatus Aminicenantales bacterium]
AVLAGFVTASLLNYGVEGRQRRFIKSVFRFYLSPDVIERVLDNPDLLRLGGERRDITAFFSDVAGFTSISEKLGPEDLVGLLNAFLTEMTDTILDSGGTLDKYEGDAIIAFWNAPLDQPDHALRAARAALTCQARLAELRGEFKRRSGHEIRMRIGLNSGPAVVGNMGSERRFDYTAIGDTMNLASRLEGVCKQYGIFTLVSEETEARIRESIVTREVDMIRVVGKAKPVRVFELIGEKGRVGADRLEEIRRFHQALEEYRERRWSQASALFEALAADPVAKTYAGRCRIFEASPPPDGWDGVADIKEK